MLNKGNYNVNSLSNIITTYNNCGSDYDITNKYIPKSKLNLFSGFSANKLSFKESYYSFFYRSYVDLNINAISFIPKISFERVYNSSLMSSSLFFGISSDLLHKDNFDENSSHHEYRLKVNHINLQGGYKRYFFQNNKKYHPYISVGLFTQLGRDNFQIISTHIDQGFSYDRTFIYSYPVSLLFGGGVNISDNFLFEFSYNQSLLYKGTVIYTGSLKYRTLNFLVGYSVNF